MKKLIVCILLSISLVPARAQLYELERLALDIEKLLQLKNILSDLYKGYEILSTGYNTIKNISQGNFNLHKAFLDGLLAVSPAVQKYTRVVDIVDDQEKIVSEYKAAYRIFQRDPHFTPDELVFISGVYNNLISRSEKNLENLLNVITASKLRMSDAERLEAIDRLYVDTHDELSFLRGFNSRAGGLSLERSREQNDIESIRNLYGDK